MEPSASKSWSINSCREITSKYKILEVVGSCAYSDVYQGQCLSDNLTVALKEIYDYQSAFCEIESLQALQRYPNVILHEHFWSADEDDVPVLEYFPVDLSNVITAAKK